MTSGSSRRVVEKAKQLLSMFLAAPETNDNLAGIVDWRVPQHHVTEATEQVSDALEYLVGHAYLLEADIQGTTHYRLNPDRMDQAKRFVEERADAVSLKTPREATPIDGAVMSHAMRWIDATLLCFVCRHPQDGSGNPLTRNQDSVQTLLARRLFGPDTKPDEACEGHTPCEAAGAATHALKDAISKADEREPLAAVCKRLALGALEIQAFLLCLAPELDAAYQVVYGFLNDDMSRRTPTLGLICQLLGDPLVVRDQLADDGGLTRWRLLDSGAALPHADELLHVDAAVVDWLLGNCGALYDDDERLRPLVRRNPWPGATWLQQPDDLTDIQSLVERLSSHDWTVLAGEDSSGWRALLEAAASSSKTPLLRIAVPALGDTADPAEASVRLARAARLLQAVPVLDVGDSKPEVQTVDGPSLLIAVLTYAACRGVVVVPDLERSVAAMPREPGDVRRRGRPDEATLATAYAAAAADVGLYLCQQDARQLAHAFPLPLGSVDDAVRLAVLEGAVTQPHGQQAAALFSACRRIASPDLPRFARRVHPVFTLDDIVLPADRRAQLEEIIAHVKYASQVLQTWGFGAQLPYGRGVAALFSGHSGTGKTMAAQAIANALHTDTFVVDLSRVVSKYLGETEKCIDIAFRDAERAGAVLQIDEADVLFGKRTEIKDSHDFHANLQVGFILQRIEMFSGVAILTTNYRQNLDQAFLRRLRFVLDFPKPDADAREAIWRRCLPAAAPVRSDINLRFLARRFEITGANIRSITLRAAFLAANEQSERIEMRHLIAATRSELLKLGMNAAERELADFETAQRQPGARVA